MKLRYALYCILFFLPGCRYVRWGKDVFHQSRTQFTYNNLRDDYIRSLRIYDQFTTLGLFDVLWLSEEVRRLYSKENASLHGCPKEDYADFLQGQLAENDSEIAFYILASVPHAQDLLLTESQNPWTIYLCVDGVTYAPKSLKIVELPPQYQVFFGKRYTTLKKTYVVTFDAKTLDGCPILTPATTSLSLCFHTTGREDECVIWEISSPGRAHPRCVDNPDVLAYDI